MEELVTVFIFFLGYMQTHGTTFLPCDGRRLNCCSGYMIEEKEDRCVKCPVGYVGPLCKTRCPFPLYGQLCQSLCNCERSECSHIDGCYPGNRTTAKQTSRVPKDEISVKQNQELHSKTTTYMYIPTVEDKVIQNDDHPVSSSNVPTIDDGWSSSVRMSIIILVGLCILLMILYIASFGIKLKKMGHEPHLIHLEIRDNYSI